MKKSILKSIIGGTLFGSVLFFAGPFIFIVLLLKFIFTPFGMGRMWRPHYGMKFSSMGMPPFAFADKIRSMNEEEYSNFQTKMKEKFQHNRCGQYC